MPAPLLPDIRGALDRGDVSRATDIISTVLASRSAPPWMIANSILAVHEANQPDAAAALAMVARESMPQSAAVLLAGSEIEARRGSLEGATALARAATTARDQAGMGGSRAHIVLARHLHAAGDHRQALSVLEPLLRNQPDTPYCLALAATIEEALGDFAAAADHATRHARLLRTNTIPWLHAVRLLLRAGAPQRAVEVAREAREAVGPNPHIARELAGALHGIGHFAEAADAAAEGLALSPRAFTLHRQRLLSLIAAARLEDAETAALVMVRSTPINAEVTFALSLLLRALPDVTARAAFVARAIAANPHPRIRSMQAAGKSADPTLRVEARDRDAFGTEIFPPDDLVPVLADIFANAPYASTRQLRTWADRRVKTGARGAPIVAYTVPNATIFTRDGLFVIHDSDGMAVDLFAHRPNLALVEEAAAAPITESLGAVFLINGTGMRNYAHWCLDLLPQIAVADTHFPDAQVFVPELEARRFVGQTLSVYGMAGKAVRNLATGRYRVASVTLLSASVTPTFRHALQFGNRAYARHLLDRRPGDSQPHRRLYIDRPPSQRRTVVNRGEFIALLEQHGFETLDPGSMSVAQQAEAFAAASHVVGLHGAALANLMHCRKGTRVLEVHSPDHTTTAFAITALVRECDYRPHIGQSIATDGRLWAHPQDMDFRIDPRALADDLAWLLQ